MRIRWITSAAATAIHAAQWSESLDALADNAWQAIRSPAQRLLSELSDCGCGRENTWEHLPPLAADIDGNLHLAEVFLQKSLSGGGSESQIQRLAAQLGELKTSVHEHWPGLLEELELRGKPLRSLWESRGPGMLKRVENLAGPQILVPSADVLLVAPVAGGAGHAHALYNCVRIEAVLYNPHHIAETVRLAWLLSQLNADLPMFSDLMPINRTRRALALATIPLALDAAQYVEIAPPGPITIADVVQLWLPAETAQTAEVVSNWWESLKTPGQDFCNAIVELDRLLGV